MVGVAILAVLLLAVVTIAYYALTTKSSTGLQVAKPQVTADDPLTAGNTGGELAVDRLIVKAAYDRDETQRAAVEKILADEPLPVGGAATTDTTVQQSTLSTLQNEFIEEADRRLKALNESLKKTAELEPAQKPDVTKTINDEITALTGLKAKAAAETSEAAFQADVKALEAQYLNFLLGYVQAPMLVWANDQTKLNDKINVWGGKFQERLNDAGSSGNSIATAQTQLNSYQTNKTRAKDATTIALKAAFAAKPGSYEANRSVLKTYYAQLANAHNEVKNAMATADQLIAIVASYK